jgi:hypothetical protein
MTAPIEPDDKTDPLKTDPPMSAPPWMRARMPTGRQEPHFSNPPPAGGAGNSHINWPPPPSRLRNDRTATGPRHPRSLEPDIVPEPPVRPQHNPVASLAKFSVYLVLTAIAAYGVVEITLAYGGRPIALKSDHDIVPAMALQSAPAANPARPGAAARMAIQDRKAVANEAQPLGVVLHGATGGETIFVTGLVQGTRLSAGEPLGANAWRVPVRELGSVLVDPPAGFVGVMTPEIELRSANNVHVDTNSARLEWIAKASEAHTTRASQVNQADAIQPATTTVMLAPERIAWHLSRGMDFFKDGNFAAARLMLRPAADAGNPQAALMLGATFDPVVLAELGVFGLMPDRATARAWYQRAKEAGSAEASQRIERLAQAGP